MRSARRGAGLAGLLALLLAASPAACGGEPPVLRPIIDAPPEGTDAHPYAGLTSLSLSIARAGEPTSIEEITAPLGEPLALSGLAYGEDLVVHLSGRAGEVEVAYGRTCAIDVTADALAGESEPHLYLSRVVKWAPGPDPGAIAAAEVLAYATPDGRGAFVAQGEAAAVERFDPIDGAFAPAEIPELSARRGAVLAALPDGRALLVGGVDADGEGVPRVEALDPGPALGPAGPLESRPGPRLRGHAAVTLVDGTVLVAGGERQAAAGQPFTAVAAAWQIGFGDGGALDDPRELAAGPAFARAGHTMTRLGDEVGADVLLIGGRDGDGAPVAQVELYRPLRESFEAVEGAALLVPRWDHRSVRMPGGSVLVLGGFALDEAGETVPARTIELYDPIQGRFSAAGELPAAAGITGVSVSRLPDGRILLVGGRDEGGAPVSTVLIARLDAVDGQVDLSLTDPLEAPRAGHGAARLCDGSILVVGGAPDGVAPRSERYQPPSAGRR